MQRVIISFLVAFVLLMVVIVLSRVTYDNIQDFGKKADTSRNIIRYYSGIDVQLRSAEIYSPTYENSAARELYRLYKSDLNNLEPALKQLKFFSKTDPKLKAIADTLEHLIKSHLPALRQKNMVEIISTEGMGPLLDLGRAHTLIRTGLTTAEAQLEEKRKGLVKANQKNNLFTLILSILAILIVTITFLNQFFLSRKSQWLEGFLESILNTTQNGIVYYRAVREGGTIVDFRVEYANDAIKTLLDADPKIIIGKKLSELDSYLLQTEILPIYTKVVETNKPVQFEHHYQHNGAASRWVYLSIKKLHDGVTVAFHDIAELKRYEEELKKNIAALEQSNTELEEYAYAASHDLQEPLRKIRTFGSFLRDTQYNNLNEKGKEQLDKIIHSTERMSLLIKDLLSFSGLKHKEEFRVVDLNTIFENVLRDLEVMIEQQKAIITHDPLPEIEAIPVQMNQLFYNLVNNALKFSKQDLPLHLDVSCKLIKPDEVRDVPGLDPSTSYYEIVFSDNGIGFNQEYASQIFGLFKRLNDKSRYAGSGIGLSLCKKVVVNHGGVILANGKEGVGAQFYVYLPQPGITDIPIAEEE